MDSTPDRGRADHRLSRPEEIDNEGLRGLAARAAWVARIEEAAGALEDLIWAVGEGEDGDEPDGEAAVGDPTGEADRDPLVLAWELVSERYEDEDRELEAAIAEWLAADPEHWHILRLAVLDPWQEGPGTWRAGVPGWVAVMGTDAVLAHYQSLTDDLDAG